MKTVNWISISAIAVGLAAPQGIWAQQTEVHHVEIQSAIGASAPVNVLYAYVSKVNIGVDGYLHIAVPTNFTASHGCSRPFFARSPYPATDDRSKAWLQIALESFRLKKQVFVESTGCTDFGYLILTKLSVYQP